MPLPFPSFCSALGSKNRARLLPFHFRSQSTLSHFWMLELLERWSVPQWDSREHSRRMSACGWGTHSLTACFSHTACYISENVHWHSCAENMVEKVFISVLWLGSLHIGYIHHVPVCHFSLLCTWFNQDMNKQMSWHREMFKHTIHRYTMNSSPELLVRLTFFNSPLTRQSCLAPPSACHPKWVRSHRKQQH